MSYSLYGGNYGGILERLPQRRSRPGCVPTRLEPSSRTRCLQLSPSRVLVQRVREAVGTAVPSVLTTISRAKSACRHRNHNYINRNVTNNSSYAINILKPRVRPLSPSIPRLPFSRSPGCVYGCLDTVGVVSSTTRRLAWLTL